MKIQIYLELLKKWNYWLKKKSFHNKYTRIRSLDVNVFRLSVNKAFQSCTIQRMGKREGKKERVTCFPAL